VGVADGVVESGAVDDAASDVGDEARMTTTTLTTVVHDGGSAAQVILPSQLLITSSPGVFLSTSSITSGPDYSATLPPSRDSGDGYATLLPSASASTLPLGSILISQPLGSSSSVASPFFPSHAGQVGVEGPRSLAGLSSVGLGHGLSARPNAPDHAGHSIEVDVTNLTPWPPAQDDASVVEDMG